MLMREEGRVLGRGSSVTLGDEEEKQQQQWARVKSMGCVTWETKQTACR